jgi:hypothetical protein
MIRYSLRCDRDHAFESWFQSSAAYDSQVRRKLVTCPACGSAKVEKAIMAPRIVGKKGREKAAPAPAAETVPAVNESTSLMMAQERELRAKLKELRDHIVKNADNVGERFPNEARKMHYGANWPDRGRSLFASRSTTKMPPPPCPKSSRVCATPGITRRS